MKLFDQIVNKKIIRYILFSAAAIIIFYLSYTSWQQDISVHHIDMESLSISETDDDYIMISSQRFSLEKGSYVLVVYYSCTETGNLLEVYSPTTMNDDGTMGHFFGLCELDPDESRAAIEVTFDYDVTNLEMRIYQNDDSLELHDLAYRNEKNYNDILIIYFLALMLIFTGMFIIKYRIKNTESQEVVFYLLLLIFITMLPFMNDFLIDGHDTEFHLNRIEGTYRSLKAGQFPVRINVFQTSGYGYASPIMYPQLFIYIPALFRMLGLSLLNSYKLLLTLCNLMTALCSYFSFKRLFGTKYAGIIGSIFYMLSIYRLNNIYLRGAMGEVLAMAFLPLVFYGIYEIVFRDQKKWFVAVVGITGMFQSHILTTEIVIIIIAVICILSIHRFIKEPSRIGTMTKAAIITILLNLWSIIPLLDYMNQDFVIFQPQPTSIMDRSVYLSQMFATFVSGGTDLSSLGSTKGEMPLTIGLSLVLGILLYLYISYKNKRQILNNKRLTEWYKIGNYALVLAVACILMTSWIFPWKQLIKNHIIERMILSLQFLWRLFSPVSLLLSMVATIAVCMAIELKKELKEHSVFITFIIVLVTSIYCIDATIQYDTFEDRGKVAEITYTDKLYFYSGGDYTLPGLRGDAVTSSEDSDMIFTNFIKNGTSITFNMSRTYCTNESYIELPLYYYPGYYASINDTELEVKRGTADIVRIQVPEDIPSGNIQVVFKERSIWKAGNLFSLLTILLLLLYGCNRKWNIIRYKPQI